MHNANQKAYPQNNTALTSAPEYGGLTKYEKTCIELGVPKTGDSELNKIIRKAERRDLAKAAMQGLCANENIDYDDPYITELAVKKADALLSELEE